MPTTWERRKQKQIMDFVIFLKFITLRSRPNATDIFLATSSVIEIVLAK